MKLSGEQREAVQCEDNVLLTACPGSGKTRVIISKLLRCIEEVRGTPRLIACITYTNAAVHEIEARTRNHIQPGDESYYDICTIHSFCLSHIFRPFCYLIAGYEEGFSVLTTDSPELEDHVKGVCAEHGRYDLTLKDFEEFAELRINLDGEPIGYSIDHGNVTAKMAKTYWKRIRKAGFIDFPNIIYHAYSLLKDRPEILNYISAKCAWILVDEFQDTSDLQVEILDLIASRNRTRFFLVGDPYQSIFAFAGSRPELADEFAERITARTDLSLSGNFRSSPPILRHAESVLARDPPMVALGPAKDFEEEPERRHGGEVFDVITDYFLPALDALKIPVGRAAILAPIFHG